MCSFYDAIQRTKLLKKSLLIRFSIAFTLAVPE